MKDSGKLRTPLEQNYPSVFATHDLAYPRPLIISDNRRCGLSQRASLSEWRPRKELRFWLSHGDEWGSK
ncbi:hypothetical protein Plhal304r1_c001g0002661 [Plasmopara halstedii]